MKALGLAFLIYGYVVTDEHGGYLVTVLQQESPSWALMGRADVIKLKQWQMSKGRLELADFVLPISFFPTLFELKTERKLIKLKITNNQER